MELRSGNLYPTFRYWIDNAEFPVGPQGPPGEPGGPPGPQGIQGDQGSVGPAGPQGIQGFKGDKGNVGNVGPIGLTGAQGIQGVQGDVGPQGLQGTQGDVGLQGIQGIQGVQGDVGPTGPQGIQGVQGLTGAQGPVGVAVIGDIKYAFRVGDHNGWVFLDGRLVSSLSATQQANAVSLGIGASLPDARNKYLSSFTGALGSSVGDNNLTIPRNSLPNETLSGTTAGAGAHSHTYSVYLHPDVNTTGSSWVYGVRASAPITHSFGTSGEPNHQHTFTTTSLNGGVAQAVIDKRPATFNSNVFIYLG